MTNDALGGSRILGSLRVVDGKGAVRMEDRFDTDIDDLWSALTEPARLARWLGQVDGDLRPGGEFRARIFASEWEGVGRVEACEPPRRLLVVTTSGDSADHEIDVSLVASDGRTILVLEERGMPVDELAAYGAGVQLHVEDLATHIAGRTRDEAGPRWEALLLSYKELAVGVS